MERHCCTRSRGGILVSRCADGDAGRRRLIIFTSVVHRPVTGGMAAHGGFAREVLMWARLFREVVVVSPQAPGVPEADAVRYEAENVGFFSLGSPVPTDGPAGKIRLAVCSAGWVARCLGVIRPDDVLMARGPDSIGFLGYLLSRGRRIPRFAKYADQWRPFNGEPVGYRLQKWLYGRRGFGGPVLIYGERDPAKPHLVPFLPSSVTKREWEEAGQGITARPSPPPFRLLFVGRLVPAKGADVLLRALALLAARGSAVSADLVGDGPERIRLVRMAEELDITPIVRFHGWLGWEGLSALYARTHVFVHCSRKEGFGKVLLEAMTYALPVVGTDAGVSPTLIEPPEAGYVIPRDNPALLAETLESAFAQPEELAARGRRGRQRVVPYLLERQEDRYRAFLEHELGLLAASAR